MHAYIHRANFYESVSNAVSHLNWKVELWTWRACVSQQFLEFQKLYLGTGLFSIVYLDDYRDRFTFLAKDRPVPSITAGQANVGAPGQGKACAQGQANGNAIGQAREGDAGQAQKHAQAKTHDIGAAAGPKKPEKHFEKTPAKYGERKNASLGAAAGGVEQALDVVPEAQQTQPQVCGAAASPFVCAITNKVMETPVQTTYGGIFESSALIKIILLTKTCPKTGLPLSVRDLREPPEGFMQLLHEYRGSKAAHECKIGNKCVRA